MKNLKLTFCSGAGTVTGSNFLLESDDYKLLIDCGLLQTTKIADEENWEPFMYDSRLIQSLLVTHAHTDHIGRIPKLFHEGFEGKIYSTEPTKDLAEVMLNDTAKILSHKDKKYELDIIYGNKNLQKVFDRWETVDYQKSIDLGKGFKIVFKEAGHILGSAIIEISFNNRKIIFTGDLGNSPSPLLPDTDLITDADYLIMESVYGDQNHESKDQRRKKLEQVIEDNFKANGTLIIPTFSLERSQELLFELNYLMENNKIPVMPIFFDSPLAIHLTEIFRKHQRYFNNTAKTLIGSGDDIFDFPGLQTTLNTKESKEIFQVQAPKVIIAGSGMSTGGRILHHEKHYLSDPNNTILLIGYQSLGTLGRLIEDGAKKISIFKEEILVRAKVFKIRGYSGHKDSDNLLNFVEKTTDQIKKVFVVMGEPKAELFLVQRIRDYLGVNAFVPKDGEMVELEV